MERVLVVDFSENPGIGGIFVVDGTSVVLQEVLHGSGDAFSFRSLVAADDADLGADVNQSGGTNKGVSADQNGYPESAAEEQFVGEENGPSASYGRMDGVVLNGATHPDARSLQSLSAFLTAVAASNGAGRDRDSWPPWDNAVVLVGGKDYLAMNLSLPFSTEKHLDRVVGLEVQDTVPFDLEGFHLQHRVIRGMADGLFDVHVSGLPFESVAGVIAECRAAGIEPVCVTTPGVAAAAVYHFAPSYIQGDAALVLLRGGVLYLTVVCEGEPTASRAIALEHLLPAAYRVSDGGRTSVRPGADEVMHEAVAGELKRGIVACEKRYGTKIKKVYVFGDELRAPRLQQRLGRPCEVLRFEDFVSPAEPLGLLALASTFGLEAADTRPLVNFRSGVFRYLPYARELKAAFRQLSPYLAAAFLGLLILVVLFHQARATQLRSLRDDFHEQIHAVLPELALQNGSEVALIAGERQKLSEALDSLGSRSTVTPVEALTALARDSKEHLKELELQQLTIGGKGNRVVIEGSASHYGAIESFSEYLKRKQRTTYCHVKRKDTGTKGGGRVGFELTVRLCEDKESASDKVEK